MNAAQTHNRPGSLVRMAASGLVSLMVAGCGDSPSRMAGTIELPPRKVGPPDFKPPSRDAKPRPAPGR